MGSEDVKVTAMNMYKFKERLRICSNNAEQLRKSFLHFMTLLTAKVIIQILRYFAVAKGVV